MPRLNVFNEHAFFDCSKTIKKYHCQVCPYFATDISTSLRTHFRDGHRNANPAEDAFKCLRCLFETHSKFILVRHGFFNDCKRRHDNKRGGLLDHCGIAESQFCRGLKDEFDEQHEEYKARIKTNKPCSGTRSTAAARAAAARRQREYRARKKANQMCSSPSARPSTAASRAAAARRQREYWARKKAKQLSAFTTPSGMGNMHVATLLGTTELDLGQECTWTKLASARRQRDNLARIKTSNKFSGIRSTAAAREAAARRQREYRARKKANKTSSSARPSTAASRAAAARRQREYWARKKATKTRASPTPAEARAAAARRQREFRARKKANETCLATPSTTKIVSLMTTPRSTIASKAAAAKRQRECRAKKKADEARSVPVPPTAAAKEAAARRQREYRARKKASKMCATTEHAFPQHSAARAKFKESS